jgi:hypothetical protein
VISFFLKILVNILLKLATTGAFSFLMPRLLILDKWCEDRLGLDIIKQDKKFRDKYPLIAERLDSLEKNSHPCKELHEFEAYPDLIKRITDLEEK